MTGSAVRVLLFVTVVIDIQLVIVINTGYWGY